MMNPVSLVCMGVATYTLSSLPAEESFCGLLLSQTLRHRGKFEGERHPSVLHGEQAAPSGLGTLLAEEEEVVSQAYGENCLQSTKRWMRIPAQTGGNSQQPTLACN